jgi:hypothetical protein
MMKTYEIPSVELTQLMPGTIVLAGSPSGITVNPTPIDNEGGD